MARTQAAEYDDRKEAILGKAAALFADKGFHAASMADLASSCSVSKALLYHYFPSKEDVLYAVMASHIDMLVEDVAEIVALAQPARPRLEALLHRFLVHYAGASDRQKVLLNELRKLPEPRHGEIVAKQRSIIQAVEDCLSELDPKLGKQPPQRFAMAMLIFGMINWTLTWFRADGPISTDRLSAMVSDIMTHGLPDQAS